MPFMSNIALFIGELLQGLIKLLPNQDKVLNVYYPKKVTY